jgi:hypothetical protein
VAKKTALGVAKPKQNLSGEAKAKQSVVATKTASGQNRTTCPDDELVEHHQIPQALAQSPSSGRESKPAVLVLIGIVPKHFSVDGFGSGTTPLLLGTHRYLFVGL